MLFLFKVLCLRLLEGRATWIKILLRPHLILVVFDCLGLYFKVRANLDFVIVKIWSYHKY